MIDKEKMNVVEWLFAFMEEYMDEELTIMCKKHLEMIE